MNNKPTWWQIFKIKWGLGVPLAPVSNLGLCDDVWLKYKDMYVNLLIGADGEDKGEIRSMGWQKHPPQHIAVRDIIMIQ